MLLIVPTTNKVFQSDQSLSSRLLLAQQSRQQALAAEGRR